jgi:tripartite-type tricarboxylate transporter receptor subunit TctC
MMQLGIRALRRACGVVVAAAIFVPASAMAQAWPTRPVNLVVPYPAGGSTDIMARVLAQELSEKLGQQFVVDNKSGASGNIGAASVASSAPDGYTLMFATPYPLAFNKLMTANLTFDPETDFQPIVVVGKAPQILVANPNGPVKSLAELVSYAKANPGKLNAGIPGAGTTSHIALEYLARLTDTKLTIITYRGGGPMANDLMGGQIDVGADLISSQVALVQSGKVRALAVTSAQRAGQLPNVPTAVESGFPTFEATAWFVIAGPAKLPAAISKKVSEIVTAYVRSERGTKRLAQFDVQVSGGTPEEAKAFISSEVAKWGPVIKSAGIKM